MITELIIGKHRYHITITNEGDETVGIWNYYVANIKRSMGYEPKDLIDPSGLDEEYSVVGMDDENAYRTFWDCLTAAVARCVETEQMEEHLGELKMREEDTVRLRQVDAAREAEWEAAGTYLALKSEGVE